MKSLKVRLEPLETRSLLSEGIAGGIATSSHPVVIWNAVALQAIRAENTPPPMAARDLAIVQAAIYDSVNSIVSSGPAFHVRVRAPKDASVAAAVAGAAHEALTGLFPRDSATFDAALGQSVEPNAKKSAPIGGEQVHADAAQTEQSDSELTREAKNEREFDEKVATVTRQSVGSARRSRLLATSFTSDQLEVFTQMEVNQTDMLTIAKIQNENQKSEVIALITSGMVVAEAIKEVMKDAAPKKYKSDTAGAVGSAPKEQCALELTDDEWFQANCGKTAAKLADPSKFKADALLFRGTSEARHVYWARVKKNFAHTKKAGVTSAFYDHVNRYLSIIHPKDWLLCPKCKGEGRCSSPTESAGHPSMCPNCDGGGYLLKSKDDV